jgi:hypothetical protein
MVALFRFRAHPWTRHPHQTQRRRTVRKRKRRRLRKKNHLENYQL